MPQMNRVFIALDIGGTKLIAAAADENGTIIKQRKAATPLPLAEGLALLDEMIAEVSGGAAIAGMGAVPPAGH